MCGINGIVDKNKKVNLNEIYKMNASINHRGPDDQGVISFNNACIGHVRLSIQDLSKKGHQPMSVDDKLWIIFNGEIYNFKEIKEQLINLGYKFFSNTDTEVIINAYKEWGEECLKKFNGMWCFAILDKVKKEIIICRDRYGVKPCYIFSNSQRIIFSSEIKGVLTSNEEIQIDPNKAFLDDQKKEAYFTTSYKDLDVVQPGYIYKINLEKFSIIKKRWWNSLEFLPEISPNYEIVKENIKEKLINATKLRLVSDAKIATSLSGGVDSSIIFSILNSLEKNSIINLNPFVVKYNGNITFDSAIELSKLKNRQPIIIETDQDNNIIDSTYFSKLLSSLEINDPFTKQLKLYETQKNHGFKVSIDGHGADESHGGYIKNISKFAVSYQNALFNSYDAINKIRGTDELNKIFKENLLTPINKKILTNPEKYYLNLKINNSYIKQTSSISPPDSLISDLSQLKNFSFGFQTLYLDSHYGFMQWLLNKWDKASMASSIEIRSPFLDKDFFQYSLAIPSEFKTFKGVNKSILRDAFRKELPESINNSHFKQGLPAQKIKIDGKIENVIENIINEDDFITNKNWDGKKISKDFYDNENKPLKIIEIWQITKQYLQYKGFEQRKVDTLSANFNLKENYNNLLKY